MGGRLYLWDVFRCRGTPQAEMGDVLGLWYAMYVSGTYRVVMGDRGRVVIPADVRERHGLEAGTPLTLLETPDGLVLMTRDQLLAKVRGDLHGLDLVGELLRERRAEAEREEAE